MSESSHPASPPRLKFADLPGVVYVEGLVGHLYVEKTEDVQRYTQIFERLRTTSLDQQQSLDLMSRMCAAYKKV